MFTRGGWGEEDVALVDATLWLSGQASLEIAYLAFGNVHRCLHDILTIFWGRTGRVTSAFTLRNADGENCETRGIRKLINHPF